jgi:hypothetical protein
MPIKISQPSVEGPLLVSKWIKIPLLLDEREMENFLSGIRIPFQFYYVQGKCLKEEGVISKEKFLSDYTDYISLLKEGEIPHFDQFKLKLSPAMSSSEEDFYALSINETHWLIKPRLPIIQFQANQIRYSEEEALFRTAIFGKDAISWGITIGYPHLYQNPHTLESSSTHGFPNTLLFKEVHEWVRKFTLPTPFRIKEKIWREPIRLGRECFRWINQHPQLKEAAISVTI